MENSDKTVYPLIANSTYSNDRGLTKREYFAGLAMQGILACRELQVSLSMNKILWHEEAVHQADELLKQLDK